MSLLHEITQEDVEHEFKSTPTGKSPRPYGFTLYFFHYCWYFLKDGVWKLVEESRKYLVVLHALNATFLTLIPKEEICFQPKSFCPIVLYNVIFKIITKVIVIFLKPLLPLLTSQEQTSYVEGRQVIDNVIPTHELIHSLKLNKTPGMPIKLNMSKVSDKISQWYLQEVLLAFGFQPSWVRWIHSLVSSTFFSILVNGSTSSTFKLSRGIQQGDLLSPFLFILLAKVLGRTIKVAIHSKKLTGISLHDMEDPLSHNQFVDDNMIVRTPIVREITILHQILDVFSAASGTAINEEKYQLFLFNTPQRVQHNISRILSFHRCPLP